MSITVPPHHPLMELLAKLLHGIETVPPKEQRRMVNRACREAVKWHKKAVDDETRRCEQVARMQNNEFARQYRTEMFADATHVPSGKHLCDMIADAILSSGGLEVEK